MVSQTFSTTTKRRLSGRCQMLRNKKLRKRRDDVTPESDLRQVEGRKTASGGNPLAERMAARVNGVASAHGPHFPHWKGGGALRPPGVSPQRTFSRPRRANAAEETSRANRQRDSPTFSNLHKWWIWPQFWCF